MNKRVVGKEKEETAVNYLQENGVAIVLRNFTGRNGEIDIIGDDGKTLIFIEVKYRKNLLMGFAEESISKSKMKKIYLTAVEYIRKNSNIADRNMRFDVIAINGEKINWIKNSFRGDEIGF